jgi:chemotaxis methyl-accepting protein methylase
MLAYGRVLHRLVRRAVSRDQCTSTCFLRNRPEMDLIGRIGKSHPGGGTMRVAVVGCSTGAEVYSIVWAIKSRRPDLVLEVTASDVSQPAVEQAMAGRYSEGESDLHRLTEEEKEAFFERTGDRYVVRPHLREPITWKVADALSTDLALQMGTSDIVVANRFLCHMSPPVASECLRNVAKLVRPGGFLFVSGVDEDVRERVTLELGLQPVVEEIEGLYHGDPSLTVGWPFRYWGLEPIDANRRNWEYRYSPVFHA